MDEADGKKNTINPDQTTLATEMKNLENNGDIIKNDIIETTIDPTVEQNKDAIQSTNDDKKVASENSAALSNNAEMTQIASSNLPEGKNKSLFHIPIHLGLLLT